MIPTVESLETRDCPSTTYPTPPAGRAIFAVQDIINLAPLMIGSGSARPTPLMPVAPWAKVNPADYFSAGLGEVYQVPDISEPGEGKYFLVDRAEWSALQADIYGIGAVIPPEWSSWVADRQAEVAVSNHELGLDPPAPLKMTVLVSESPPTTSPLPELSDIDFAGLVATLEVNHEHS